MAVNTPSRELGMYTYEYSALLHIDCRHFLLEYLGWSQVVNVRTWLLPAQLVCLTSCTVQHGTGGVLWL